MNRVGMIVDCSHAGGRTAHDIMAASTAPVMSWHSNPRALWDHDRNITDAQALACARTGGLIGVNGVDIFLNDRNAADPAALFQAIDHYTRLVGPDHVGLGLDFVYDPDAMAAAMASQATAGRRTNYDKMRRYFTPEELPDLVALMRARDYPAGDIAKILGGNFLRIARQVWKP